MESNVCLGQTISGELTKGPRMLSNEGRSFRCVLREREETFHMVSPTDHAMKFFFKYGCRIIVATGITFSKFPDFSLIKKKRFPLPNAYKMSDPVAASGLNLQPSFLLVR